MARKIHKSRSEPAAVDMTPMIDVVFQMMIFFIVAMVISKEFNRDVKMQPTPKSPILKPDQGPLVVEIDRRGMLSSHNAHMDRATFRRILKARYDRMGEFPILIRADRRTRHQDVRAVMDICSETGIWRLTFVGIKEKKTAD